MFATFVGILGHDDRLHRPQPRRARRIADLARTTLAALDAAVPVDQTDAVTAAALRERLGLVLERHELGLDLADINNIASPVQLLRDVFDITPTATVEDWSRVADRLAAVPAAVAGYRESLRGRARRRLDAAGPAGPGVREPGREFGAPDGFYVIFARRARTAEGAVLPDDLGRASTPPGPRPPRHTASWRTGWRPPCCPPRQSATPWAATVTPFTPASSSAPSSTSTRPTPGGWRSSAGWSGGWRGGAAGSPTTPPPATTRRRAGGDRRRYRGAGRRSRASIAGAEAFRDWMQRVSDRPSRSWGAPTSTSPSRSGRCAAGSRRRRPASSTTRRRRRTSPGRGRCGGRCRRGWTRSPPGGRPRPSTTRACRGITCSAGRWPTCPTASTAGGGWAAGSAGTARAGRSTRSGSWRSSVPRGRRRPHGHARRARAAGLPRRRRHRRPLRSPGARGGRRRDLGRRQGLDLPAHAHPGAGRPAAVRARALHRVAGPGIAYKVGERAWLDLREQVRAREGDAFDLRDFHRRALDLGSVGLDVLRSALLSA